MELNTLLQALARDMAEHLRPMVADMVKQELANAEGERAMEGIAASIDLEKLAEHLDIDPEELAQHIDISTLAGELTDSQLSDIAGDIDLSDLADEFDAEKIADKLDINEMIREFFQNETFSIRP